MWKLSTTFRETSYVVLNTLLALAKCVHAFVNDDHGQCGQGDILCYTRWWEVGVELLWPIIRETIVYFALSFVFLLCFKTVDRKQR